LNAVVSVALGQGSAIEWLHSSAQASRSMPGTRSVSMAESEIDLAKTYDAVVVGSGAAGGMAVHVLTSRGLEVLLLEAGKKLPIEQELRSMEWPYDNPHRGALPPDSHSLTFNEYTIRRPPYGPGGEKSKHLYSYVGNSDYVKNVVVDERENPYTGTNYAWVRARCLGGKTNIWGRLALRLSDYDFKAKSRDGYGEDWPIGYSDIAPYYDKVDLYLGITGVKENLAYLPDSIFQRPTKLNCAEVALKQGLQKMGRVLTQYRAGVTTDGLKHNKYRSRCYGRGACSRKGGCDIHAAFDSPTGLIYPAMDTPDQEGLQGQGQGRHRGRVHAGIRTPAFALQIAALPRWLGKLERPRRPQFLRAPHGTPRRGPNEGSGGQAACAR
jgi:choline dehydrogenase-like flavoprotein